jgi:exosortase D (VPLPA-CTERM-specific)
MGWLGFIWFAIAVLASIALFWIGFESLGIAWATPEYSHGPLIPILSLYLFLRQLRAADPPTAPPTDRWPGFVVTLFALFVAMIGNVARIPDIVTYAVILWTFGILLIVFGWRYGKQFWPPIVHLVFMLPLPAFIYWQVSIQLQFLSSEIGVWFIQMMGISVYLDGNIIDLGIYKLHVAEACSGLRYLFPVMSFTYIFAVLYQGSLWHKAILLLSAAPITILMNSFRIGVIGVMVDNFGIEHAEGFLHLFEGWVIFISCILILFALAWTLKTLSGDRRSLADALDLDTTGLGAQMARVLTIRPSTALSAAAIVTAALAGVWHLTPERASAEIQRTPLLLFPDQLGEWRASAAQRLDAEIEDVLAADDYLSIAFDRPDAEPPVDMFVAWYRKQTEGSGIHSPEVCIPAGGWEIAKIAQVEMIIETVNGQSVPVKLNRAVIQKGLAEQLVYFWYDQRGRKMASDYLAKAVTVLDAVAIGRTDGALMRLITPITQGETEEAADRRLQDFMAESLEAMPSFVPGV